MIEELIDKLIGLNIRVELVGEGNLKVDGGGAKVPADILAEIKHNKADLVHYLNAHYNTAHFEGIPVTRLQESYPLSAMQRRLWFLSQFAGSNAAYNLPRAYVFEGAFNEVALTAAFHALIARHEILRTVFREDEDGVVRQFILPPERAGFAIERHDLRAAVDAGAAAAVLGNDAFIQPFDFVSGPLLRAGLYQVADNKWIFTYVMHHIISDGWSMDILFREALLLYESFAKGIASPLSPLRIQYRDYASWQQEQLSGALLESHKRYWLGQFDGDIPVLELPSDKVRPPVKTYNGGAVVRREINASGFRALLQPSGATLFMGLLALVKTLFYRYTQRGDITIGTPVAGREHADLEDQIGFYVNTLALRTRFSGDDSYRTLLHKVKEVALGAYEHQVYPFDELVDELKLQRDMSRNPLFDVQVIADNAESPRGSELSGEGDWQVRNYEDVVNTGSVFDLVFHFTETATSLETEVVYNTDVFSERNIIQYLDHLENLLEAVQLAPDTPISRLAYLGEAELRQLHGFNNTSRPIAADTTLVSLFEQQVALTPDLTAVIYGDTKLSYKELDERSGLLASYLCSRGYGVADRLIGIMLDRSADLVIAILGVLKSGAAYVPVDPSYPRSRKSYILEDARVELLLTETACLLDLDYYNGEIFATDVQLSTLERKPDEEKPVIRPEQLAYVIYTSGSTGVPKGVMIEHGAISNTISAQRGIFGIREGQRGLQFASLSFDASVWEIFMMLTTGATLCIINDDARKDPSLLEKYINDYEIDIATLPPSYVRLMALENVHTLKHLVTAGEAAIWEKAAAFAEQGTFYNAYGPTESSICASVYQMDSERTGRGPVPIGRPIDNTQLYVMDDAGGLLPLGAVGEICISGRGLARGYLNNPDLTAQKFIAHPFRPGEKLYRTGDLGRWMPDGNLVFTGRKDQQIKIGGHRIELGEIEHTLLLHPQVEAAVVLLSADRNGEKELVAYVVIDEAYDVMEVRTFMSNTLPAFMLPHHYVRIGAVPLTANGKTDKTKLPSHGEVEKQPATAYIAPRTETEIVLAEIWSEILGKEKVGVRDDFFELGGSSLKAMMLVKKLKDEMKVVLSLRELFEYRTIERTAENLSATGSFPELPEAANDLYEHEELSYNQQIYFSEWNKGEELIVSSYPFEHFDAAAFKVAVSQLIARHEVLRTIFIRRGVTVIQQILQADACRPEINDVVKLASEAELHRIMDIERKRKFDLSSWPLFDIKLYDTGKGIVSAVVAMHHILTDGDSGEVMKEELSRLYVAALEQKNTTMDPLPFQYQQYVRWQRSFLRSLEGEAHKTYWLQKLAGCVLSLPVTGEGEGDQLLIPVPLKITGSFYEELDRFTRKNALTRTSLLLGALVLLISRWSRRADVTVITSVAGRTSPHLGHLDLSKMIGFFSNLLLVRNIVDREQPVHGYLQDVQRSFLDDLSHDIYPVGKLMNELPGITPAELMKDAVFYNYHHFTAAASVADLEDGGTAQQANIPVPFTFGLIVREFRDGLSLQLLCNGRRFTYDHAESAGEQYKRILEQIINNPDILTGQIPEMKK
ncbi:non-ribosomal peptide synthetase [Chitinophaga flava]|uniref:Carrier domain-containing protein n=1 Tax=Chitinophaga flava TaxID=2259036 RepID=A0A365XVW9_9BACT|nr:non-ribosomal peptide synthetase [Chitinophaga flava]RBL90509.1 hypothetical protein DF182_29065 [Chitinophaga flava]